MTDDMSSTPRPPRLEPPSSSSPLRSPDRSTDKQPPRTSSPAICPADPSTNPDSARQLHEEILTVWLLVSAQYRNWKANTGRRILISGEPGCGKTFLCSTAIDDVRDLCLQGANTCLFFYFSLSDERGDFLRSLVTQLGCYMPRMPTLREASEKQKEGALGLDELQIILSACMKSWSRVFLFLDALDACPEEDGVRQGVIDQIETLVSHAPNLNIFATSRELPQIRESMDALGFESLCLDPISTTMDDRHARTPFGVEPIIIKPSKSEFSVDTADDRSMFETTTNATSEPTHASTLPTSDGETHSVCTSADMAGAGNVFPANFQSGFPLLGQQDLLSKQFACRLVHDLALQDKEQCSALLAAMPKVMELLRMFSRVRSCQAREIGELRATFFIRSLRFRIKIFFEHELTKHLSFEPAEIYSGQDCSDSHIPTRDFRDTIWLSDDGFHELSTGSTIDEESEPAVPSSLLPESLAEFQNHTSFLLESAEYRWLQSQLKTLVTLDRSTDTIFRVRKTLLEAMPDVLQLTKSVNMELQLALPWNPKQFLKEQFPTATKLPSLGSTITICGSQSSPYATRCSEYILQTWPNYGEQALLMAQNYIIEERDSVESGSTGTSQTRFHLAGTYLEIIEKAEVLIWLAIACRSTLSDSIESCEPTLLEIGPRTNQIVEFSLRCDTTDVDLDQNTGCWKNMFRNPVLALGYPVPLRKHDEVGLEMSATMLAAVGRTPWATVFNGGLVLKGYNTMAVAVRRIGSSILWHFMVRKDGNRIAYHERDCAPGIPSLEEAFFPGARHFVAWTAAAELLVGRWCAGADYSNYDDIWFSKSDRVRAGVRMDPAMSISVGKYFTGSGRISVGARDTPTYLSTDTYKESMARARSWTVIFSDTTTRVHWLADGASTILHLCKAYLSPGRDPRRCSDDTLHRIREAESSLARRIREAEPSPVHGSRLAYETLISMELRQICLDVSTVEIKGKMARKLAPTNQFENEAAIEGTYAFNTFQWLAEKYFRYLEQLRDRASNMRMCKDVYLTELMQRQEVEGFDFMDVLESEGWVIPRSVKLENPAQTWLALATRWDSINLLGANFGPLIKCKEADEPNQGQCGMAYAPFERRDYLVAPMSVLKNVARRGTKHTHNSIQPAEDTHWHNARSSFVRCQCGCKSPSSRCKTLVHPLHDKPAKPAKDEAPILREHPIFDEYSTGAVIFGHEHNTLTKPRAQSPQSSLAAVPSDSGYGSQQADGSMLSPSSSSNAVHSNHSGTRITGFFTKWKNRLRDKTG